MSVTKWTLDYDPQYNRPIVPVLVSMHRLPLFLHERSALFDIARMSGSPLWLDSATLTGSYPSVVQICVEIDFSKSLPSKLYIRGGDFDFYPIVTYEDLPAYCSQCRVLGHDLKTCEANLQPIHLSGLIPRLTLKILNVGRPINLQFINHQCVSYSMARLSCVTLVKMQMLCPLTTYPSWV